MARKEENIRKRSKDYREEYTEASLKIKAIEARIKERTLNLFKRYPDVVVDKVGELSYTANDVYRIIKNDKPKLRQVINVERYLDYMRKIEEHIDSLHPHQQGKLFGDRFLSSNPSNPDAKL